MLHRTLVRLSKKAGRTIVRDPRAKRMPAVRPDVLPEAQESQRAPHRQPMAFEPSQENRQAVGSSLGSYMLAGAGMAIGFSIVGAVFGGF